ncbi:hypothetical protein ACH5RR_015770 [Cinchona calisaya]|uniref:Reverse transcriptase n=1 Tax=Cinchona calisaya TaxID=153742 RepID=A0ABD2ZU45_9GENT
MLDSLLDLDEVSHFPRLTEILRAFLDSIKGSDIETVVEVSSLPSLSGIRHTRHPWTIGGDFNVIEFPAKYLGRAQQHRQSMADFSHMIMQYRLKNLAPSGSNFTWTGVCQGKPIWKRLDRILINQAREDLFPELSVTHLNRTTLDHSPLLWSLSSWQEHNLWLFIFQNIWMRHHLFLDAVKQSWVHPILGSGILVFSLKFRRLKGRLKDWNKDVFGNIFYAIQRVEEEVQLSRFMEVLLECGVEVDVVCVRKARNRVADLVVEQERSVHDMDFDQPGALEDIQKDVANKREASVKGRFDTRIAKVVEKDKEGLIFDSIPKSIQEIR